MQKKVVIFLAIGVILVLGGGLWWLGRQKTTTEVQTPAPVQGGETIPVAGKEKVLVWNDPAGFSFEYPNGVSIDNHPEDKVNYANLDLTVKGIDGKILVLVSDTNEKTIDNWVKKDKRSQLTGGSVPITLGGKPARKLTFADDGTILIAAIDEEVLFTLELSANKAEIVEKIFNQIISSFKFVYPTSVPAQSTGGNQTSGDVIEEEEIVE